MRILFITDYLPYPLISGDSIRVYNLIRRIAKQHELTLVAAMWTPDEAEKLSHLREFCHKVETGSLHFRHPLTYLPGLLRYTLEGKPPELRFMYSKELANKIKQIASAEDFDVIHFEQSRMALYLEALPTSARRTHVLAFQNIVSDQYKRIASIERRPIKKMRGWLHSRMMRRWEPRYAERFDHVVAVSDVDRRQLIRANPRLKIDLVPNGVDTHLYQPLELKDMPKALLFVGSMGYAPCVDGILYFCQQILPFIERKQGPIDVWVVGADPSPEVRGLTSERVHVTGRVEDVIPYYSRCAISIVPLRAGGGSRLKILEAMALGRPVVSTSIGCEGLDLIDGRHLLIADSPDQFADRIVRLQTDRALYKQLSAEARQYVVKKYDWDLVTSKLLEVYTKPV